MRILVYFFFLGEILLIQQYQRIPDSSDSMILNNRALALFCICHHGFQILIVAFPIKEKENKIDQ